MPNEIVISAELVRGVGIAPVVTDTITGARELQRARARNPRFPWVSLCELPTIDRYVVWYENESGQRSVGYYTTDYDDACAEFSRRAAAGPTPVKER